MLNFKCETRPEMDHNVGTGQVGRLRMDGGEDKDYQDTNNLPEAFLSIMKMIGG